ncbi:hypothetical protein RCH27_08865 [Paracidovorax citrulli]|uniref:hypothetical protein n=1 Tax=Paracidovorax citrulli TaxID=80869 RepID=UPI003A81324B
MDTNTTAASGAASLGPIQRFNLRVGIVNPEANGLYVRYVDHVEHVEAARGAAPAAQEAEPALDDSEVDDLARGAFETAMSYGVDFDAFRRLAMEVRRRCAAALPQADARAVPEGWRELAARVMDALAEAQERTNREYPEHVRCYPSWERGARWMRWHAEMFRTGKPIGNGAGQPEVLAALAAPTANDTINAAVEKSWDRFQQAMKPSEGEPPAVPYAQHERELLAEVDQREQAEHRIDLLCDAVLCPDRQEWSSAYGYQSAINDVAERIEELERKVTPAPAAGAAPTDADTVDVMGVRANGEHVNLGTMLMPPSMKAREIATSQFGGFQDGDGSDAELCFGAMEELLSWLTKQGWGAAAPVQAAAPTDAQANPRRNNPWRNAVLDLIDDCPGLGMEQDRWLTSHVKDLDFPSAVAPAAAPAQEAELRAEVDRLNAIINTPQADDFLRAVSTEAEHQRQRWPSEHDEGKAPADWFWLVGYLAGKALHAHAAGNAEKAEHHIITTAAALANWHLAVFGKTNMRPGIDAARARQEGQA